MADKGAAPAGIRDRLLTAAERMLLTMRYDEVSVRGICAAAGANSAAVHYHFGSKEALISALIEDRLGPLWAARLSTVTAEHGSVSAVVDAVIEPFVVFTAAPTGLLHLRLLAELVLRRRPMTWTMHWFQLDSWVDLLPEVSAPESRRRWQLAFELIIMRFGGVGLDERGMSEDAVRTLRNFVVAGLTAPEGEK